MAEITESRLQFEIIKALEALGWVCSHTTNERNYRRVKKGTIVGFPDLTCLKVIDGKTKVILIEVKTPSGKMRPEQIEFAAKFSDICYEVRSVEQALCVVQGCE